MGLTMAGMKNWLKPAQWLLPSVVIPLAVAILWQELRPMAQVSPPTPVHGITVTAEPLDGIGRQIGPFRLIGALALASDDADFGGISGLAAAADGRLVAVTDTGQWLSLRPILADGQLAAVADVQMAGLLAAGEKSDSDAEALVLTPDGRTLISMEQRHRIVVLGGQAPPFRIQSQMFRTAAAGWPTNGGGEALARLPDGSLLWISESARRSDGLAIGLLIASDGATRSIGVPVPAGFSPTDATVLDGQRLLLLLRKFNGVSVAAAIGVVDMGPVRAGDDAASLQTLAQWDRGGPWPVDNMEGLALVRAGGRTLLYVVSDDNFSAAQRTILLQLELITPLVGTGET
jgi:hypothetical protein